MLDTSPRVILVQNVGLFTVGDNLNAAKIAGDLTETNARVISSVEETSKYKFIPEKDLFDVEYWSLEQAKIKKAKKYAKLGYQAALKSNSTDAINTLKIVNDRLNN